MKTSSMQRPSMWSAAPMMLSRTTAENLWAAMDRACPYGPWASLPRAGVARFVLFIFCADEASSNKRLVAQCIRKLAGMREG